MQEHQDLMKFWFTHVNLINFTFSRILTLVEYPSIKEYLAMLAFFKIPEERFSCDIVEN